MIHIVGAGPGDRKLITVRGRELLEAADVVIFAGSLIPRQLLSWCKKDAKIYDSSRMTLDEVLSVMKRESGDGKEVVRLHTGDPSIYGAIREQIEGLSGDGDSLQVEIVPGVSSFTAAAAALQAEYTVPGVSQSVIITRMEGRTPVPEREKLEELARHGASMAIFLSASMAAEVSQALISSGGFDEDTPAAIAAAVAHEDEKLIRCSVGSLEDAVVSAGISRTALILVGDFLRQDVACQKSRLYAPDFSTGYRRGSEGQVIRCIFFTGKGAVIAEKLREGLGEEFEAVSFEKGMRLDDWTRIAFAEAKAVIFIGAAGIAVRAIAPHLRGKALDPAVIVVDDRGENVIPILSGHIGGGNALAKRIAGILGGKPVITTSTDINGVFAIDTWAAENGMRIINPDRIRAVSSKLLRGEKVLVKSYVNISGELPENIVMSGDEAGEPLPDVVIGSVDSKNNSALQIVAPVFIIGAGCRRGVEASRVKEAFEMFCRENSIREDMVAAIASINIKKDEPALRKLAEDSGAELLTFDAEELNDIEGFEGEFSSSDFVESITGVDCVCERSAVKAAGARRLFVKKTVFDGVTFAAAEREISWEGCMR